MVVVGERTAKPRKHKGTASAPSRSSTGSTVAASTRKTRQLVARRGKKVTCSSLTRFVWHANDDFRPHSSSKCTTMGDAKAIKRAPCHRRV